MGHLNTIKIQFLFACALFLAVSCGKKQEDAVVEKLAIDSEFTTYVTRFEQASAQYGTPVTVSNLIIQFGTTRSASERGACEIGGGMTPTITVNQSSWDRLTDAEREEFLFHEMGHCVLRRLHKTGKDDSGKPLSVMYPIAMDGTIYRTHEVAYLQELFGSTGEF